MFVVGEHDNLAVQVNAIKSLLTANEHDYGGYLHDERFVAFFNGGGMKYEGDAGLLRNLEGRAG